MIRLEIVVFHAKNAGRFLSRHETDFIYGNINNFLDSPERNTDYSYREIIRQNLIHSGTLTSNDPDYINSAVIGKAASLLFLAASANVDPSIQKNIEPAVGIDNISFAREYFGAKNFLALASKDLRTFAEDGVTGTYFNRGGQGDTTTAGSFSNNYSNDKTYHQLYDQLTGASETIGDRARSALPTLIGALLGYGLNRGYVATGNYFNRIGNSIPTTSLDEFQRTRGTYVPAAPTSAQLSASSPNALSTDLATTLNTIAKGGDNLLDTSFNSGKTKLNILAEVKVNGSELHLDSFTVYGADGNYSKGSITRDIYSAKGDLIDAARENGFTSIRITGERVQNSSSANPGKKIDIRIPVQAPTK